MLLMPDALRAMSASALAMSAEIQNSLMSCPWLAAAVSGLEPASPICTSPEAIARITSPPPPNMVGADADQAVFKLPIYDSPLPYPNVLGLVESQAFAPFRRFGQRVLYKWYWLRDEKL